MTATVTVALLVLGVQIIFYTRSFGEEYERKRDAIREAKNTILVEEIDKLFFVRGKILEAHEHAKSKGKIYIDEGDEVRQFESLATVRQYATDVEDWVGIIERGKKLIRRLGLSIIASGVVVGSIFAVMISSENLALMSLIAVYVLLPTVAILVMCIVRYFRLVRRIDDEYVKVMQRKTGMSMEEWSW